MDCFFRTKRFRRKQHFDCIHVFFQEFFRISRNLVVVVFFLLQSFRASSTLTLFVFTRHIFESAGV